MTQEGDPPDDQVRRRRARRADPAAVSRSRSSSRRSARSMRSTLAVDLGPRFAGVRRRPSQPVDTTAAGDRSAGAGRPTRAAAAPPPPQPPPETCRRLRRSRRRRSAPSPSIRAMAARMRASRAPSGAKEKDLTLAVARRLKARDRRRGSAFACCSRETTTGTCRSTSAPRSRTTTRPTCSSACTPTRRCGRRPAARRFTSPPSSDADAGARVAGAASRSPTFGGGAARHRARAVGSRADPPSRSVDRVRRHPRAAAARPRAAGRPAGRSRAAPRARVGEHAGGADRDGLSDERRTGEAARGRRVPERVRPGDRTTRSSSSATTLADRRRTR